MNHRHPAVVTFGICRQNHVVPIQCLHAVLLETSDDERVDYETAEVTTSTTNTEKSTLLPGSTAGFYVTQQWALPKTSFNLTKLVGLSQQRQQSETVVGSIKNKGEDDDTCRIGDDVARLGWTPFNLTLPGALMLVDPETYPSLSRSRKACRKGQIVFLKRQQHAANASRSLPRFTETEASPMNLEDEDEERLLVERGFVSDRVYPGDIIGKQTRMGNGYFALLQGIYQPNKPSYETPTVVYEDDHLAIINKPAGMVVYTQRKGLKSSSSSQQKGVPSVRASLPFILTPPAVGTFGVLRRPVAVHRLDKPTSGLLLIAKTVPARFDLFRQFRHRVVQKTYVAIVQGRLGRVDENQTLPSLGSIEQGDDSLPSCAIQITSQQARSMGFHDIEDGSLWNLIDMPLDGKEAVTLWRPLQQVPSLHAQDGCLTLVELKPKTGRFHQLRRHLAWFCGCPIVGDTTYDGGTESSLKFRNRGMFLCASSIRLQHPFYNHQDDEQNLPQSLNEQLSSENNEFSIRAMLSLENGTPVLTCSILVPAKFESFLKRERERFNRFVAVYHSMQH